MESIKAPGQTAFEIYTEGVGGLSYDTGTAPEWAALSPELKQVWERVERLDAPAATLRITERELSEIKLAMLYVNECNHGTAGHNQLVLLDKFAKHLGFTLDLFPSKEGEMVGIVAPFGVEVVAR